jgi:hypothetical protein
MYQTFEDANRAGQEAERRAQDHHRLNYTPNRGDEDGFFSLLLKFVVLSPIVLPLLLILLVVVVLPMALYLLAEKLFQLAMRPRGHN